ncbi:hypothetical protein GCM10023322_00310 [Rugosimonospora acidiphila]|uniref:Uncharacterized protein n=1 Tax=Rugosimonospora acidiphila TaxID=556531 RepID=A0ABP9RFU4_9ACTN
MRRVGCARCADAAGFVVSAGDPDTFWYRSESVCLNCLAASKRWAGFVGTVTVVPVDAPGVGVQAPLFEVDR